MYGRNYSTDHFCLGPWFSCPFDCLSYTPNLTRKFYVPSTSERYRGPVNPRGTFVKAFHSHSMNLSLQGNRQGFSYSVAIALMVLFSPIRHVLAGQMEPANEHSINEFYPNGRPAHIVFMGKDESTGWVTKSFLPVFPFTNLRA